jgi:O-antigen ligase
MDKTTVSTSPKQSKTPVSLDGRRGALLVLGVALYLLCLGLLGALGWRLVTDRSYETRGVSYGTPPDIPQAAVYPLGVNASLERYDGEDLDRALTMIQGGGFRWVRQRFPWAEIEPARGAYDWETWDRIVAAAGEHELEIIAVLETSPAWARAPLDANTPDAPPQDFGDYAEFVTAFAARYRDQIDYYQVWDEPNLYPHWGERYVDPAGYTHLLQVAYTALKEVDPESLVLTAGLAPNVEEGGRYMSDILFLRKMYEAGAKESFDIVAIKPYGMWYEASDRQVSPLRANFSRAILLRDVMVGHGDTKKAVWAVEFGWCALPPSWAGQPAPWGSDSEEVQARRTVEAIERALDEWPWMGVLALQHFHPLAEPDDPIIGFALVTDDLEPRLTYTKVQELAEGTALAGPGWYSGDTWAVRLEGSWVRQDGVISGAEEGAEAVLPFRGTRLDVVARGPLELSSVTVDGQPASGLTEGRLSLHSGERRVTLASGLAYGEHLVRLIVGPGGSAGGITGFVVIREASLARYYLSLALLAGAGLIVAWRLVRLLVLPAPLQWWKTLGSLYLGLPLWAQVIVLGVVLGGYYFSPSMALSLVALLVLAPLVYLRIDLGLAFAVVSIPFFLRPKMLLGQSLSVVELLTLLCFAAWLVKEVVGRSAEAESRFAGALSLLPFHPLASVRGLARGVWRLVQHVVRRSSSLDLAVLFFVAVSLLSLTVSENFGVSFYELRTVILGPVVLYLLLREVDLGEKGLLRLVDALILGAVIVSIFGLYQYFFSGDVITAEGVRRVRAVYGSPNNLGLYLGRIVPLLVAFGFFGRVRLRRYGYLLACVPVVICLYLTHSRGAWLLGVPAALLFLGAMKGRRALLAAAGAVLGSFLALLPIAGAERIRSLFDLSGGTGFLRLKLWEATVHMIRDHPLLGVGLDNFLYQYPRYMLAEAWQEPDLSHPHNIILDWWTRLGVLGVGALIWLEVGFYRLGLRLYGSLEDRELRALVLGLMASMVDFLAHGLIDNSFFLVDLAFVFFLSLGIVRRLELGDLSRQPPDAS